MSDRHVNGWSEDARTAAVAKAARWTREQAERLGYSPDEILAAIRRGWTAEEVEALAVAEADRLVLSPAKALAEKLKAAPVLPVNPRVYFLNAHDRFVLRSRAA